MTTSLEVRTGERRLETAPGLSLFVREHGPRSAAGGQPVVLLHGGGQTGASWGRTAEALARRGYAVWSPDHRGHGRSDRAPGGDYRIESFVDDVRAIVRALERPPVLVGASLGGIASLLLAGEGAAPPIRALVLVDIALGAAAGGVERIVTFMRSTSEGFASMDEAREAIARYAPQRAGGTDEGLRRVLRQREDGRWVWHWDPRFLDTLDVGAVIEGSRMRAAAKQVHVPALLVRGGASDVVSEELAQDLVRTMPNASWVDVRDVGHMVAGDDNDAFTSAVLRFLSSVT